MRAETYDRQIWLESAENTIADLIEDGEDLMAATRVYVDFIAPPSTEDDLVAEIERLGWNVRFQGAGFIHARREKIWTIAELRELAPYMIDFAAQFNAAYDGWYLVSPAEDCEA